ncbi:uncharacterized protein LOC120073641 [Benincasa hispida]|uniref:uncharacterized protein LOC120073641 n=1 Tax=Benincasa hispida TaxID=102211 RepID=UPI001902121A|nr:uncharacterized protein LOC120073641 [Benincasa hispida]
MRIYGVDLTGKLPSKLPLSALDAAYFRPLAVSALACRLHFEEEMSLINSHSLEEREVYRPVVVVTERSAGLNSMSSCRRGELIMPGTSSSETEVEVENNCKWSFRAVKIPGCDIFKITKYMQSHTCSIGILNHDHRQETTTVVDELIKDKFTSIGRVYKPCHIIEDMRKEYGVNISYDKAWRARETTYALVRGTLEESYAVLHAYGEALKMENPATRFEIELENDVHFKYMLMALGPCIRGFSSCRPVIIVNGSHLKGKYKGTMLVGVSMDGNNQVYPLAYDIGDNETDRAWKWFMSNLKCVIGEPPNLVFVPDRAVSIGNAIHAVFSIAFHGLCIYRLKNNILSNFKDSTIVGMFKDAARAFCMSEFQAHWD